MSQFYWIIIGLYAALLGFILLYSFTQLTLLIAYLRAKKEKFLTQPLALEGELPKVTVQLPMYNELFVAERVIDQVMKFDYPKDKLQVQVLDDSTDETLDLVEKKVAHYQNLGFNIQLIHRTNRQGYKAGALAEAMPQVEGEFIAIFDADFLPRPNFLRESLGHFVDANVGVVQSKWEHINKEYSLLTALQAFGLDAHFSVEQKGRNRAGHFINFNGTAGVWRKSTIEDAGGWQSDTITEDLDLSYRAQLKGWKFVYLEQLGSPSELPANMPALKTQQYRWTKGAAECARKNLGKVVKTKGIGVSTKIHAIFHLMNSFLFVCIMLTALLSVPLLFIKQELIEYKSLFNYGGIFLISLLILSMFYMVSYYHNEAKEKKNLWTFWYKFPAFLSVSMGLSLHNAIAVIEGYMGKQTPFVRTPKFNIQNQTDTWKRKLYVSKSINWLTMLEGILALYFFFGIILGFYLEDYGLLIYHIMLFWGFGMVYLFSIKHSLKLKHN